MADKKQQSNSPMRRVTSSLDVLVLVGFTIGVLVVIALFIYVLTAEFSAKP